MKMLTDWNCHLLPMMGEWITAPKDTRDALLLLNARTGIRRFCMMAEFDCGKDSLPGFLIARDRAMREIKPLLPEGFHVFAGGYIRLRPGISEISGLRKLCLPRTGLLPVLLPWAGLSRETALEWNRLLYHTSLHPLLMETDHFIRDGFSPENVKRLLRLDRLSVRLPVPLRPGNPERRPVSDRAPRNRPVRYSGQLAGFGGFLRLPSGGCGGRSRLRSGTARGNPARRNPKSGLTVLSVQRAVFDARSLPSAQMAFLLVLLQHLLHLLPERLIDKPQGLGHILMYRAFADTENGSRLTDRCPRLGKIFPQHHAPGSAAPIRYRHGSSSFILSGSFWYSI